MSGNVRAGSIRIPGRWYVAKSPSNSLNFWEFMELWSQCFCFQNASGISKHHFNHHSLGRCGPGQSAVAGSKPPLGKSTWRRFEQGQSCRCRFERPAYDILPQWLNFKLVWLVFPLKMTKSKEFKHFFTGETD